MTQINELESIQGGSLSVECKDSLALLGLACVQVVLITASFGAGPIGWFGGSLLFADLMGGGLAGASAFVNCL